MFPLSTVLFPHAPLPLHVFEPRYRTLMEHCLAAEREFGVVLIARGSEVGGGDERFEVGTVARIEAVSRFDDGRYGLLARGTHRIAVTRWLPDDPYPRAEVEELSDVPGLDAPGVAAAGLEAATAAVRRARTLLSEMGSEAPVVPDLGEGNDDATLWRLCALAPLTALDRQRLLATDDGVVRVAMLTELCGALADDLVRLRDAVDDDGP
jgi:Lon protease-like protein